MGVSWAKDAFDQEKERKEEEEENGEMEKGT